MPNYIGKLLINFGKFGAAETYAMTKASIDAALTTVDALIPLRAAMLADDSSIVGAEVSDVDIRGDALLSTLTPAVGTFNSPTSKTYNPVMALLYRMTDASHIHRSLKWIRMIPEDKFDATGKGQIDVPWDTAASDFEALVKAQCSVPHKIPAAVAPPFYTFFPVDTLIEESIRKKNVGRAFFLPVGRR